jgi:CheY-like chemotaxis protein
MHELVLKGIRVLVVEDEAVIALDLKSILQAAGATVVGPARTLSAAKELAASGDLAAAILDVQLGDGTVFPVVRLLRNRGMPFYSTLSIPHFLFHTFYSTFSIPHFLFHTGRAEPGALARFGAVVIVKPAASAHIVAGVARLTRRG